MEDCRIGKELKQSTCRYVKACKRGWSRNEKFICRKTNRRLVDPNEMTIRKFTSKSKSKPLKSFTSKRVTFENPEKTPKVSKLKVGNSFMYTHPDGRKEKAKVTGLGSSGQLELHIPSLADEVADSKFKKNEKVFFIYKTGAKEQGIIKKVYDGEYDVQLLAPLRIQRIKEKRLRAMSDYNKIDTFPYYVLKNA